MTHHITFQKKNLPLLVFSWLASSEAKCHVPSLQLLAICGMAKT